MTWWRNPYSLQMITKFSRMLYCIPYSATNDLQCLFCHIKCPFKCGSVSGLFVLLSVNILIIHCLHYSNCIMNLDVWINKSTLTLAWLFFPRSICLFLALLCKNFEMAYQISWKFQMIGIGLKLCKGRYILIVFHPMNYVIILFIRSSVHVVR